MSISILGQWSLIIPAPVQLTDYSYAMHLILRLQEGGGPKILLVAFRSLNQFFPCRFDDHIII